MLLNLDHVDCRALWTCRWLLRLPEFFPLRQLPALAAPLLMPTRFDALPPNLYEITRLIAGIESQGSFATWFTRSTSDLDLHVDGVGRVALPVTAATVRQLRKVAQPAHYGLKEQTLLDPTVRDTSEIPGSRLSINKKDWQPALDEALERIRRDLGLSLDSRIEARLHNLLIYSPGQFFKPHQDSEKADGMIGSLVVALPSRFTGGEFVITHHDETLQAPGSAHSLTFIAFYTDCRHEVRPVLSGNRVVLTWNLIVSNPATMEPPATATEALVRRVRDYFDSPKPPRWSEGPADEPPDRLVYLLDHEYSQRGLHWDQLKNGDALRAAMLLEVALQLDCEAFLALADIQETWNCEDDGFDRRHGRRWRSSHYDDDDACEDDYADDDLVENDEAGGRGRTSRGSGSRHYELTELIESIIELRHWVAPDSRQGEAITVSVDDREICYTKPSIDCEPFESEHEGYTGNAGNTVDHWYHRAAIVLWPRERNFVIRAKASAQWAIDEISRHLATSGRGAAADLAQRLQPFWPETVRNSPPTARPDLLASTLILAIDLDSPALAAALLAPFQLIDLTPEVAPRLANLIARLGLDCGRAVLHPWLKESLFRQSIASQLAWLPAGLPALCHALCEDSARSGLTRTASGATEPADAARSHPVEADGATGTTAGQKLADELLLNRWAWLHGHIEALRKQPDPTRRASSLIELAEPLLAFIECADIAQQPMLRDDVLTLLTERSANLPLPLQLPLRMLQAAAARTAASRTTASSTSASTTSVSATRASTATASSNHAAAPDLTSLRKHLTSELTARLAQPTRDDDDWSIPTPIQASDELAATLTAFLRSPQQRRLEWPLAEKRRQHIHRLIDSHGLPVRHTTVRRGSPYTLVLEKTRGVFEDDSAQRRDWTEALAWLASSPGRG